MINWITKKLLSNRYIYNVAKNAHNAVMHSNGAIQTDVPEITPFTFVDSDVKERRINLLVPALSERHVFGGISTALRFFDEIRKKYPLARIIVTDETSVQLKDDQFYSKWCVNSIGHKDLPQNAIVVAGNRVGYDLPISENDYFVTTAWWTTFNAFKMLHWQSESYCLAGTRKLVYFVQDFEPGFYAWSSRYALAESTYRKPSKTVPVFNTKILNDFFVQQGYEFDEKFYFDPILNPTMNNLMKKYHGEHKEKQILIYGRPSVERNLFELIVQALRIWAEKDEESQRWRVLSAGEYHDAIDLGYGLKIESVGKLNLEKYAELLARSSVGISLMLSPHPSYPPLEMAKFGMKVITNTYANKDLRHLVSNIYCPSSLDPEDLYLELHKCCRIESDLSENINNVFSTSENEFNFINEIVDYLS